VGQFDFLNDDAPAQPPRRERETYEHRDTGMVDAEGKRIGFEIRRFLSGNLHLRWVSVMKDGDVVRSNDSSFHETFAEAEAEVDRKINRAVSRYARLAAKRDMGSVGDFDFTSGIRIDTKRRPKPKRSRTSMQQIAAMENGLNGCAKQLHGCGCLLMMIGGLMLLPFLLAFL
jgi:hypothetical protein